MLVKVLYFAVLRERLGMHEEMLELGAASRVHEAIELLAARHPPVAALRARFRVAVNTEFVPVDRELADGDELALIPPVAGGSHRHVRLLDQPLSLDRVVAAVTGPDMGGIVTFTGIVRSQNRGLEIMRLSYEAYDVMAVAEMTRLCEEIEGQIQGARLAVEHRVGTLAVGELAVVIAAAAPHRAEAFSACRAMIDQLKERVPIWKKEFASDGSHWIGLGP